MHYSRGRHYTAIPGPSVVPDQVLQAMHQAGPNIYDSSVGDLMRSIQSDLKTVACTQHSCAMYIANGHGVWEAALANLFSPGDRVLVLATGRFALGWAAMARALGIDTEVIDFGLRDTIDVTQLKKALAADTAHEFKAILACHVDTSTSVLNDVSLLRTALDDVHHPALLMIDCIASFGCDRFEMDALGVDVMVAACQKGLMTPAGLGFVFFNEKAHAVRKSIKRMSSYWDWTHRANPVEYYQFFGGTSPTHHLYGLRVALDMILNESIESVWQRHALLAGAIGEAFDTWGTKGSIELNIQNKANRSKAVTSVRIDAPHGTRIRDWVEENAGITLGIGLGMADSNQPEWHGFFRVGHMGHINQQMTLGVLGGIDAALKALDIPHAEGGIEAATRYIADNCNKKPPTWSA